MWHYVIPDADRVARDGLSDEQLKEAMQANLTGLNALVAPYERVQEIEIMPEEFEKTPKRSIRRFCINNLRKLL